MHTIFAGDCIFSHLYVRMFELKNYFQGKKPCAVHVTLTRHSCMGAFSIWMKSLGQNNHDKTSIEIQSETTTPHHKRALVEFQKEKQHMALDPKHSNVSPHVSSFRCLLILVCKLTIFNMISFFISNVILISFFIFFFI